MVVKGIFAILVLAAAFAVYSVLPKNAPSSPLHISPTNSPPVNNSRGISPTIVPDAIVIATNLDTPWSLAFLPDGSILVTERAGRIRLIEKDGGLDPEPVGILDQVNEIGEGGLLGMAIDPEFEKNHYIYLYYTYHNLGDNTLNRVVRMTYVNRKAADETTIIDSIPGASNHNGGRLRFGPDGYLYITTGDAQEPSNAQNTDGLAGKILRVTKDGKLAPGNPFNSPVYSYGHRNPQGLAWDEIGQLYSTEHGRSGIVSGLDEFNKIEPGKNYGWPDIEGTKERSGMVAPILNSGATSTWAPGSLGYLDGTFYFGGLRGSALYKVTLSSENPKLDEYLKNQYGRIRDVVVGPDKMLYITTSNQDGRGTPQATDDRVVQINPNSL